MHVKTHSKERHQCSHCNKVLKFKSHLIGHLTICKESTPVVTYSDSHEVREDSNEVRGGVHNNLTRNKDSSEERLYQCDQCDKSYKKISSLKNHAKIHNKYRPYQCSHCNKAFKTKINLIHHSSNVHSEDRVYQCSRCDKAFKKKPHLFAHQVTHLSFERKSKHPRKSGNHADNDKSSEPMQNPSHTAKYLTKQRKLDSRIDTNKWSVTETVNRVLSNDEDHHNAPHNESTRMFLNMVTDEIREILYQGLCAAHKHLTANRFSTETPNGINPNKDRNEGNHYINPNKDRNEANNDINPNKDRNEANHHINPNKDNIDTKNNINSNLDITEGQNDIIPKSDSHNRINDIAQEEFNKNFTLTIPPEGVDNCEPSQRMSTDQCPLTGSMEILSNMHEDGSNINILQNKDLMDEDVNEFVEHLQIPSPQGSDILYGNIMSVNTLVGFLDESIEILEISKLSPEKTMPVKEMNKLPRDDSDLNVSSTEHCDSGNSENTYDCHLCNKSFPIQRVLMAHLRWVHNQCLLCGKYCYTNERLTEHLNWVHRKDISYQCD